MGFLLMDSIRSMTKWPPSSAGNGRRFIMPRLILKTPVKYNRFKMPLLAALPAIVAMPTGPDKPSIVPCPVKILRINVIVPDNISHTVFALKPIASIMFRCLAVGKASVVYSFSGKKY